MLLELLLGTVVGGLLGVSIPQENKANFAVAGAVAGAASALLAGSLVASEPEARRRLEPGQRLEQMALHPRPEGTCPIP